MRAILRVLQYYSGILQVAEGFGGEGHGEVGSAHVVDEQLGAGLAAGHGGSSCTEEQANTVNFSSTCRYSRFREW